MSLLGFKPPSCTSAYGGNSEKNKFERRFSALFQISLLSQITVFLMNVDFDILMTG